MICAARGMGGEVVCSVRVGWVLWSGSSDMGDRLVCFDGGGWVILW